MKSREGFSLEPSKKERELVEKLKENPKGYIEDQVRIEMERRFEDISTQDQELAKLSERGSKERLKMIDHFLPVYEFVIRKWERLAGEKLHDSFYSAAQKPDLIGRVLDKVLKNIKQTEQMQDDKARTLEAKKHRGTRDHAPDTLHYGD